MFRVQAQAFFSGHSRARKRRGISATEPLAISATEPLAISPTLPLAISPTLPLPISSTVHTVPLQISETVGDFGNGTTAR